MSVARELRLQRVRESSISPTALLERKHRVPQALQPLNLPRATKRQPLFEDLEQNQAGNQSASESPLTCGSKSNNNNRPGVTTLAANVLSSGESSAPPNAKAPPSARAAANARPGWTDKLIFAALDRKLQDYGVMERIVIRSKEGLSGERELARSVLRPELSSCLARLSPELCAELQRRIFARIKKIIGREKAKHEMLHERLDRREIFHTEVNAHRVHTMFLAALQKNLDVPAIEEECLVEMLCDIERAEANLPKYNRKKARSILFGIKAGATLAKRDSGQNLKLDTATAGLRTSVRKSVNDDQLFNSFVKWHEARERLSSASESLGGVNLERLKTAAPILGELLSNKAASRRLVRVDLSDDACEHKIGERDFRRRRQKVYCFENHFRRESGNNETGEQHREAAERERGVAEEKVEISRQAEDEVDALRDQTGDSKADTSQKRPRVTQTPRRWSLGARTSSLGDLQPRLEKIWFDLDFNTSQKLGFLQKYASVERAHVLPRAIRIWEDAAVVFSRRMRLLEIQERLQACDLFGVDEFLAQVKSVTGKKDLEPPDSLEDEGKVYVIAIGHNQNVVNSERALSWISGFIGQCDIELANLSRLAMNELDDKLPELQLCLSSKARARQ